MDTKASAYPWLKSYQPGVPATIDPDSILSLVEVLETAIQKFGPDPAFSNMGTILRYQEIDQLSQAFASFLQQVLQLAPGERWAIMLPNCLQYPVVLFGVLRAGLVVVNVNPLYTATELAHQLEDSGAVGIVTIANFAHVLEQALPKTALRHVVVTELGDLLGPVKGWVVNKVVRYVKKLVPRWQIPGAYTLYQALSLGGQHPFIRVPVQGSDKAFLQYTGGTTGVSKGAVLTHRNMVANLLQASAWVQPLGDLRPYGGVITALPLYHIFSLTANCFMFFHIGIENILITNPRDLRAMITEMARRPFCALTGVNTLFNGLLNTPKFEQLDFSRFKCTLGGGMAVQRAVALRWKKVTGVPLLEAYGLTETSPAVSINPLNLPEYNGSIGLPIPSTEIKIVDEYNQLVVYGEAGELCVKGPQVMAGYWQRPDETALVLQDGWLRTGDIATLDEEGFIRIVDRKKDMIIISGFNVYPNEVEDVIAMHEGVKEVAVVGVPCRAGEMVKAYVVLKDKALTVEALLEHCHRYLTGYKVPKEIEFRSDLPKTNVGKVLRRALRDEALASQGAGGG